MSKQSGDDDEPRQQMTGVPQQGTAELSGVGICIPASLNLMRASTVSQCNCVRSGVMRSYLDAENTSRAAERGTKAVTEEQSVELSDEYSEVDAELQNRKLAYCL